MKPSITRAMRRVIAILSCLFVFFSCSKPEETILPSASFDGAVAVTLARTASVSFDLALYGGLTVSKVGIAVSTAAEPVYDEAAVKVSKKYTPSGASYELSVRGLEPQTAYNYQLFVIDTEGTVMASEVKTFTTRKARIYCGVEYVDLGLTSGNRWAAFNTGDAPAGSYYMWQAAPAALPGDPWRIPSQADWTELMDECFWSWDIQNGIGGMQVDGPNGASIFLPASGYMAGPALSQYGSYGAYLTSDEVASDTSGMTAWSLFFGEDFIYWYNCSKYLGGTLRVVAPQFFDYEY